MSCFDDLPIDDIVHENLMPMLDYESRIQLNRLLLPIHRKTRKFPAFACESHELYVLLQMLTESVNRFQEIRDMDMKRQYRKKALRLFSILSNFEKGRRCSILLRIPHIFYAFQNKLKEILDPNSVFLQNATPHIRSQLRDMANILLRQYGDGSTVLLPQDFQPNVCPLFCQT